MIFHTIAICDGYCGSTEGAKYSLPSREVICDSIECEAAAHGFDAMVFVAACDKIVPGMLMAAARLNLPSVMVTGGPMLPGRVPGEEALQNLSTIAQHAGRFSRGEISAERLMEYEDHCMPGSGCCAGPCTRQTPWGAWRRSWVWRCPETGRSPPFTRRETAWQKRPEGR